jgi:type II secretion system protein J
MKDVKAKSEKRKSGNRRAGGTVEFSRQRGGFTLIEIMVAMAIFALVLAAIYSTWSLILRGSAVGREAAARVQRERMALRTIQQALGSVQSYAADLQHYSFQIECGDAGAVSFVAKLPDSFPRSGRFGGFNVRRVLFSLEGDEDGGNSLVLRQWPVMMEEPDDDERETPLVLARKVRTFSVETWDARREDWTCEWEATNSIPPSVKVTLSFERAGQRNQQNEQEITRVMALPSVTVPTMWQVPTGGRRPPTPGGGNINIRTPPVTQQ